VKRLEYFVPPFIMDFSITGTSLLTNLRSLDLHAQPVQLGILGFAWGFPYAVVCPFAGKAAGRFDRRIILLASTLLYALYATLCSLAKQPIHLILAGPIGGVAAALFWPAYETILHDRDKVETNRRLSIFNVAWTLGVMSGAALGGAFYERLGGPAEFGFIAAFLFCDTLYIAWVTRHGIPPYAPIPQEERRKEGEGVTIARRKGYMRMAWIANFAIWFTGSTVNTIFPKLARSLHITDAMIGVIMASVWVMQLLVFYALSRTQLWHYRIVPMLSFQIIGVIGILCVAMGGAASIFILAFLLMGAARGLTYSSSLFYSLDTNAAESGNTGLHETIVGIAYLSAPLVAGYSAAGISLRAPFVIAMGLCLLGMGLQILLWRQLPARVTST
jgi:DHA1 family multidrug resistance protein-like MFS transporter